MSDAKPLRFSTLEEEFFRVGSSPEELVKSASFEDLSAEARPRSLWRRLFRRSSRR
jgi:hypothetical protein